ncbi:hypothetical protein B0H14DRAFT_2661308 [Mycena olivaceomarginata]|nr:hypothetical protein B0H14DRAFT_2661308 [Mycena olivaceomarginata]
MQRKLLEQMMGPEAMGVANANLVWNDEKVCRNFLCGTCPHALFTNTKMDLGACPKSHTERLKTDYNAAKEANPTDPIFARFQLEYESNIFSFVDECDRRIRAAHRRLEKTPEENARRRIWYIEIAEIELAIQGGTEKIETMGEQGKVEESMREMAAIEALKNEKGEKRRRELQQLTDTSGASGHQKLRVCDVCGAYLSVLDSDRRLADHFGGKASCHFAISGCIWGTTSYATCLASSGKKREKAKNAPASSAPAASSVSSSGAPRDSRGGDYRPSRGGDDHRDRSERDRGYDRHSSSRYDDRRRDRERSRSPGRSSRRY